VPEKECISRKKFIRLGAAVGLGAAAVPLVSACGGGGGSAGSGEPPKASDVLEGGPKIGKGQTIAKQSEVKPGSAFPFTDADTGQQSVLVHLADGEFAAYSAVCTHQACTVAYKDGQLACPCHGSVFDPAEGAAVLNGPANRPLPEVAIRVEGGEIVRV
jgi:Rieske Fe-S protein